MNRFWEPYILGVLAEEGKFPGSRPVFVNNSNDLQATIRILSTPPHSFPNSQSSVTCWGSDLEQHGFEDHLYEKDARIQSMIDFLDGKLLIFQMEKKITPKDEFFTAKNIQLLAKKPSFSEHAAFSPVPLFIEKREIDNPDDYSWNQFITNLRVGHYIGRNDQVSKEPEDTPRFLLYKTLENDYFAVGEFESHHYAHGGFSFTTENQEFKFKQMDKKITNEIYMFQHVAFIGLDEEHDIITSLQQANALTAPHSKQAKPQDSTLLSDVTKIAEEPSGTSLSEVADKLKVDEEAFMKQFIAETKRMNLKYKEEDLYNFHTCVKTGGLTILAGMSGTGKSQLINAYQRGLNIDSDKFIMVPVSPTWTDDSDLIGYPDTINNVYRAADSGIVNLLIEAEKNRSETFIICFDEMNLAKVEHYFSQFLSVLEMDKGRRKLKLYNRELENRFYNGSFFPPEVNIGDNVIFTGTVNLDESTHHFSDKVLDRSNLLTLHVEPFKRLLDIELTPAEKIDLKQKNSYVVHAFIHQDRKMVLTENELEFLWEVHLALGEISSALGIGPRVVKQIDSYIKNLSNLTDCPIDRRRAFDLQFVQRVMPKIRGSEEILGKLVGTFDAEKNVIMNSLLVELFDKYASHSDFDRSRSVISEKAKELARNGFAF
ncbi:AAA family ATPase [Sporosarcina sp. YIM B06819]|uniref:McrB family protein n=1 Tax=Sporosarcina sp. YIM B06819 TaxID=3081769 RepID=UPI00298D1EE4|nr:AAA family ATPase [Sporosarcina sp. YIM B06819]